ncbi:MAG: phenylalanine--tRNA ligase subunit beta, partial [Monoglobales bacterium]
KVGESPAWIKERLKSAGVRPINNIVDITNFVMLEYGQPMHAFDYNLIKGSEIIVRNAEAGEKITTLDGTEHKLDPSMLVIADAERAIAVAGVMGGENSEIQENTNMILFESANFDGASVRITAKKLGMRTEASGRYEKGLDPNIAEMALDRACELVEMLGAGEVTDVMQDVYGKKRIMNAIEFNADKINNFLGTDISEAEMIRILTELECKVEKGKVTPPTFRADLEGFADIAEEVLRFHGYDKMPMTLLRGDTTAGGRTLRQSLSLKIKNILVGAGGFEILTYSFTSPKSFDMLKIPENSELRNVIKIINPLGEENSVMRRTTVGSMLENLANNYNSRNEQAKLFEIGKIFNPVPGESLADEPEKLTIGMYGSVDFFDLKGMVEVMADAVGVKNMKFAAESENPTFHPGRTAKVFIGGKEAGIMGEIHPDVLKNYGIPVKAYVAEIDLDAIIENIDNKKSYVETPKFPAVTRDIAMLVSDDVPVADIEDIVKEAAGKLLEELKLFDVYKGSQIAADKKSVAYSLSLRSAEKTLGEDEVNAVMDKVLSALSEKIGAELR